MDTMITCRRKRNLILIFPTTTCLFLFVLYICSVFITIYQQADLELQAFHKSNLTKLRSDYKIILWYYPPRYLPKDIIGLTPLDACPNMNCLMTRNKLFLSHSDAVIFSAEYIQEDILPPRILDQVWIFHNNEPPYLFAHNRAFHKPPWSSAFNWTMDFRHDSDIVRPYAILRMKTKLEIKNYTDIIKKKTKLVAIMVSNCLDWSGRLAYIRELNKWIPVDIYGSCGINTFPRQKNKEWIKYLNFNYKFYLAFENLHCKDYISEKFFNNFNLDLVSVARGGGNYSRDVPQGTFINVDDFESPKMLAAYLSHLHGNENEYINILKEKDRYYFEKEEYEYIQGSLFIEHYHEKQPLCGLCSKLNNLKMHAKIIPNIVPWFTKGICKEAKMAKGKLSYSILLFGLFAAFLFIVLALFLCRFYRGNTRI